MNQPHNEIQNPDQAECPASDETQLWRDPMHEVRAWLLNRHRPVGGWRIKRRYVVLPYPAWEPRVCAADLQPWPDNCPALRALRAEDPELDHAIESGYLPASLRD